jgi:predicted small lipoprotein YifL
MKKTFLSILAISSILILTACGKVDPVEVNNVIDEVNNQIEEVQNNNNYKIEIKRIEEIIPGENKDVDAKVSYEYPVIKNENNSEIINKINENFKNEAESAFTNQVNEFKNMVPEIREWKKLVGNDMEYSSESRYKVEYNKNNIVSFSEDIYYFTGGVYPNIGKASRTINLETGKEMELKDIFTISDIEVYDIVLEKFNELADQEGIFFDKDIIKDQIKNVEFFLNEDGIVFFFNENIIGPHALGIPSIEILYNNNPEIFKEIIL